MSDPHATQQKYVITRYQAERQEQQENKDKFALSTYDVVFVKADKNLKKPAAIGIITPHKPEWAKNCFEVLYLDLDNYGREGIDNEILEMTDCKPLNKNLTYLTTGEKEDLQSLRDSDKLVQRGLVLALQPVHLKDWYVQDVLQAIKAKEAELAAKAKEAELAAKAKEADLAAKAKERELAAIAQNTSPHTKSTNEGTTDVLPDDFAQNEPLDLRTKATLERTMANPRHCTVQELSKMEEDEISTKETDISTIDSVDEAEWEKDEEDTGFETATSENTVDTESQTDAESQNNLKKNDIEKGPKSEDKSKSHSIIKASPEKFQVPKSSLKPVERNEVRGRTHQPKPMPNAAHTAHVPYHRPVIPKYSQRGQSSKKEANESKSKNLKRRLSLSMKRKEKAQKKSSK